MIDALINKKINFNLQKSIKLFTILIYKNTNFHQKSAITITIIITIIPSQFNTVSLTSTNIKRIRKKISPQIKSNPYYPLQGIALFPTEAITNN